MVTYAITNNRELQQLGEMAELSESGEDTDSEAEQELLNYRPTAVVQDDHGGLKLSEKVDSVSGAFCFVV